MYKRKLEVELEALGQLHGIAPTRLEPPKLQLANDNDNIGNYTLMFCNIFVLTSAVTSVGTVIIWLRYNRWSVWAREI